MLVRYAAVIIFALVTQIYPAKLWECTTQSGQFIDFSIDDSSHTFYLVENFCKDEICPKSKVLHIDTTGHILDSIRLNLHVWKMAATRAFCYLMGVVVYK